MDKSKRWVFAEADQFNRIQDGPARDTSRNDIDKDAGGLNSTSFYRVVDRVCLASSKILSKPWCSNLSTRRDSFASAMVDREPLLATNKDSAQSRSKPIAFLPVVMLSMLFTANQWARQAISYIVDFKALHDEYGMQRFMNVAIGFDEAQYSVLASVGFATVFSIVSVIAGGIVDKVNSRDLLTGTAVLWAAATIWQGTASSFSQVLAGRVVSGFGQAFSNPASYATLARLYPEDLRASVNGLYSSGVYFGGGLAALSVLLDEHLGWRLSLLLIGGIGLLMALCVQAFVPPVPPSNPICKSTRDNMQFLQLDDEKPEPQNEKGITAIDTPIIASLVSLVREPAIALLLFATSLRFLAGFTIGIWIVPFYRERFPGSIGTEFALLQAIVTGVAGFLSVAGGGLLADRLSKSNRRFRMWVPAFGSLLAVPCWLGALNASSLEVSMLALFFEYIFAECWFGPTVAELQYVAPKNAQGLITGLFSCLTLVGNFAPFFIGIALQSGDWKLQELLTYSIPVLYSVCAIVLVLAGEAVANFALRNPKS